MQRVIRLASTALQLIVAVVLFLMMLLTGIDVIGRYVFNRPVGGADELIAAGMALLIACSLPLVTARQEQITVDVMTGLFRGAARRLQVRVVNLIGAVVLLAFGYQLYLLAGKMVRLGDHSSMMHVPHGPLAYTMSIMAVLSALVTLVLALSPRVDTPAGPSGS